MQQNNKQQQTKINMEHCRHFSGCSQNLCPLDYHVGLRPKKEQDKCRWMREPQRKKVHEREFVSGGRVMPDGILNFVPEGNLKWLNESSQNRWIELKNKIKNNEQ